MNKKAFTLIELIVVVVILSLIALVVFPAINSIITTAQDQAYESQISIIVKAAEEYYLDNTDKLPETGSSYVSIQELIDGGYLSDDDVENAKSGEELTGRVKVEYSSEYNQYVYNYVE